MFRHSQAQSASDIYVDITVELSARVDYAIRLLLQLASADQKVVPVEKIVSKQVIPLRSGESILRDLRRSGLVHSHRGVGGGYALAAAASEITLTAVVEAVGAPLISVAGTPPRDTAYTGVAKHLPEVWLALEASIREVLDKTTLQDVLRSLDGTGIL